MELQWPLILFTFFLCLAGGTMAVQGMLTLLGRGRDLQNGSLIVSAVALVVGGIAVFMHLEHWERIFNAFGALLGGNGLGVSGITLELWGCVAFAIVLLLYFLFMRRAADKTAPKWCAVLAVVVGLALPAVTGESYTMPSIPAWNTPLLVIYYVFNAILLGSLVVAIIACVKHDGEALSVAVKTSLVGAAASLVVVIAAALLINSFGQFGTVQYYFDPTLPDTPMTDSAAMNAAVLTGPLAGWFWGLAIAVGLAVPLVCAILAARRTDAGALPIVVASAVCAVVGSFAWRCILYVIAISVFALF